MNSSWRNYFTNVDFGLNHTTMRCLFSELIPTEAILVFNGYIIYHLIRAHRPVVSIASDRFRRKYSQITSWMTVVLLFHSTLFLSSLY